MGTSDRRRWRRRGGLLVLVWSVMGGGPWPCLAGEKQPEWTPRNPASRLVPTYPPTATPPTESCDRARSAHSWSEQPCGPAANTRPETKGAVNPPFAPTTPLK